MDKVKDSNTYKNSWFVYAESFDEGDKKSKMVLIGDGLTEKDAQRIYDNSKFMNIQYI
mgnify:CR=1 FL=1